MTDEKRIPLAAIAGAHGIGGEVHLKLFAESLDSFKQHKMFDAGGRTLTLESVKQTGKMPIARFVEVTDRNTAEALRSVELTVPREALPPLDEGEFYHVDLIGVSCLSQEGEPVGIVVAVENFGAGDIIEIEKPDGAKFMVPLNEIAVPERGDHFTIASGFIE